MKELNKKYRMILLLFLISKIIIIHTHAQGIKITNGAKIITSGAVNIKISGKDGNLEIDDSSELDVETEGKLMISGDLDLNSGTARLKGTVFFTGGNQVIASNNTLSIQNMIINKSGNLTLQTPLLIQGNLDLIKGKIIASLPNILTLNSRTSFNGGSTNSYVVGTMEIQTKAASGDIYNYNFPLGDNTSYYPVAIGFKQNNTESTTYRVNMSSVIPGHTLSSDLEKVSAARYWNISNGSKNNFENWSITLPAQNDDGATNDRAVIAKASNSSWENIGGKDITIPGTVTSTKPISALGDFIIASAKSIDDDKNAPNVIPAFPETYALNSDDELIIAVEAEDISGIQSGKFGFAGISTDEEIVLSEITGNGKNFTETIGRGNLVGIDPLGIRYQFVFIDNAGNEATTTGETYWLYPNNYFKNTSEFSWREIGKNEDYSINDYNIIALPFEAQKTQNVLSSLGAPDDTQWRLFSHNAGTENFFEYGKANFSVNSNLVPQNGYFLIMRNGNNIRFGGQIVRMNEVDGVFTYEINLKKGWNLIGNPFPYGLDWQMVRNHPLNAAISQNIFNLERLKEGVADYVNDAAGLNSFEGAFLYYEASNQEKLYIPPTAKLVSSGRYHQQVAEGSWKVNFIVDDGKTKSQRAGVGMHPDAYEGIDIHDALQVPKPGNQVEFLFNHYGQDPRLNQSVVSMQNQFIWEGAIVGKKGTEVTISWDQAQINHLDQELYLWDKLSKELVNLEKKSSHKTTISEEGNNPIKIFYGSREELFTLLNPGEAIAGPPYPNPVERNFIIPVTISKDSPGHHHLSISVYDITGSIVGSQDLSFVGAGNHKIDIDLLKNKQSGLYYYKMQINDIPDHIFTGRVIKK